MKSVVRGIALAGLIVSGCGAAYAESRARTTAAGRETAAALRGTPDRTAGIAGCAATLSVDVRRIIATPSIATQATALWSNARRALAREDEGHEAIADLARLGVRSPSDIHSVEMCVTAAPGRGYSDSERAGFLIRGPFTQGIFNGLVMKWADSDVEGLWQHKGTDVVHLDDGTLFAQRRDGSLVIAKHASALTALLDAPLTPSHAPHAVALHVTDVPGVLRKDTSRDAFPAHAVQSLNLDVSAALDRVHFTVLARNELAASDVLAWFQTLARDAMRELDGSLEAGTVEEAIVHAVADATITRSDRTVTLEATLPKAWPDRTLEQLAREL